MIKVGFVAPTEREVSRFYTIFEKLNPQEMDKLKQGMPKQMEEIENTLREIRASEDDATKTQRENERIDQTERLMMSRMDRRL
uniref:FliG_C domain-containing protein n=3 Tax=Bursaphelenchus xylophilus TaxID=6326 RepID=A0A1I7RUT8_BURXY